MARASDYEVRHALTWARNYREIESFEVVRSSGRKWLVRVTTQNQVTISGAEPSFIERHIVPTEMVFTSREALAFVYGLAISGSHYGGRQAFAAREWNWDAR